MFSISKNDVSEFLKKEKNTNEFYGSFFSFFPLPPIHLVIPSESRELGATRDLSLQRPSFSLCFSLLLLASNYSFVFKELKIVFNFHIRCFEALPPSEGAMGLDVSFCLWYYFFYLFFFPSTTNTPCHPDGVPRTRGDEGSSTSAPFILTLFLTLTPCFELQFCVFRIEFSFQLSSPSFPLQRGR